MTVFSSSSSTPAALAAAAWVVVLLAVLRSDVAQASSDDAVLWPTMPPPSPPPPVGVPAPVLLRKLLRPAGGDVAVGGGGGGGVRPHRVEDGCAGADDIAIDQAHASPLPSGVPAYTVDIINRCTGSGGGTGEECAIANIHVRCGWFSSVSMVDPLVFRRVGRDDCLVNDGKPLQAGETISFEYSNSFPYQLTVVDATCVASTSPAP